MNWIKEYFKQLYISYYPEDKEEIEKNLSEVIKVREYPHRIEIETQDYIASFDKATGMGLASKNSHTISETDLEILNALKVLINKILEVK